MHFVNHSFPQFTNEQVGQHDYKIFLISGQLISDTLSKFISLKIISEFSQLFRGISFSFLPQISLFLFRAIPLRIPFSSFSMAFLLVQSEVRNFHCLKVADSTNF
jgi:hypothetical protein